MYNQHPNHTPKFSDVFRENNAFCVEFSVLAKKYLDSHGIKSRLMSGEFIQNLEQDSLNFPEPHTFLVIEAEGRDYIYDPTQPVLRSNGAAIASVLILAVSLKDLDERLKTEPTLISCKNIASGETRYYGVGDMENVLPENIVSSSQDLSLNR